MSTAPVAPPRARQLINPAALIAVCCIGLTILGLTILFSASASFKQGPYYYLNKQILGVFLAGGLCFIASRINLDYARRYSWWIAGIALFLLVLVLIPGLGISVKGSRRWLGLGPVRLQVSELAKFALVFCLSHYLALNQTRIGELVRGYLVPLALIGAFVGLIMLEPDFGTAALALVVGTHLAVFGRCKMALYFADRGTRDFLFCGDGDPQPESLAAFCGFS
jgi:cell division protein FtsW